MAARVAERARGEVLQWVVESASTKVICARLNLALPTVKCDVTQVLRKCGARSGAELIAGLDAAAWLVVELW